MSFDVKKFLQTKFEARTEEIPVPDMKDFFLDDAKPVWLVKGVTGQEYARANEAVEKNNAIAAYLEGLISPNDKDKIQSMRGLVGLGEKVPNEIAKRIELLKMGSVDPIVSHELALKICTNFPIEFYDITNKISMLTGRGHVPGKLNASGVIQK